MHSLPNSKTNSRLSPARLILDLLDADPAAMSSAQRIVAAGSVFDFSQNQMRVALSRLTSERLLRKIARGHYALSPEAEKLHKEIQRWHHLDQSIVPWTGDWGVVVCGNLAAESSALFRAQQRALSMRGLRRWRPGLWLRPNNLKGGLQQLVSDLQALGLDAIQGSFVMSETDAASYKELLSLWNTEQINSEYSARRQTLGSAILRLQDTVSPMRSNILMETMELGSDTIRFLLKDPLLPDGLTDSQARANLVSCMEHYDRLGRELWQTFINELESRP